jgi:hypothetical protein
MADKENHMLREVEVVQVVRVTMDEAKFTPEFMEEFRRYFYDFTTLDDHAAHIAQLAARGLIDTPCFIEGYGPSEEMGISVALTNG